MAALTVAVGACSSSQGPAPAPASEPAAASAAPETAVTAGGVTKISDIAGPACNQVPADGPGSAQGMVDDRVATAASHNPLLSTLVAAVTAANLGDTLNSAEAVTVFAPINPAFDALPPDTVKDLTSAANVAQPAGQLSKILTTHVVGARYDAKGLQKAGTVDSLEGSTLTIGGRAPTALTVSSGGVTAKVICANIPTANATVFLIDAVLKPAA
jgi:uncharacterized surface protein with fasciclin (FAS1) repeats